MFRGGFGGGWLCDGWGGFGVGGGVLRNGVAMTRLGRGWKLGREVVEGSVFLDYSRV